MPALVPCLLKAGLCVGFGDPISNIIVNTVSTYSKRLPDRKPVSDGDQEKAAKRRRRKALFQAAADTANANDWPLGRRRLLKMPVATRSLEALVAFLTYYFRYLPACEALEYLYLAKADLLAAVQLVFVDRNAIPGFSYASHTSRTALTCAALAACHPKPRALVNRSCSLVSHMEQVYRLLAAQGGSLSCATIEDISRLLMEDQGKLCRNLSDNGPAPPDFGTLQSPHEAGHCYGPLVDPVYNIVLNTLWYKNMFPSEGDVPVVMICSRSLVRGACCSLHGLVAYLCACFRISKQQAMHYLLFARANLWGAIQMARLDGHVERTTVSQCGAYKAAATAAWHPDPDALVAFFLTYFPRIPLPTEVGMLDVQRLSELLFQYCYTPQDSVRSVPALSKGASLLLSCILEDFKNEECFVHMKVNDMLKKYTQQTNGPEYDLHVVCGLNSNVGDSFVYGLRYGPGLFRQRRKHQYSHINFLAIPRGSTVPSLFFAECSNDENVIPKSSCWPIMGHRGRCFHCENEGAKIIHPNTEIYKGCHIELKKMACSNLIGMAIEGSITDGESIIDSVDICEEDCIYFDASRDVKCAEFLNACAMNRSRLV